MVWDGLGWSDGKVGTLGALNTALTLSPLCFQLALEGRAENMRMKKIFENVSLNRRQIQKWFQPVSDFFSLLHVREGVNGKKRFLSGIARIT